MNIISEKGEEFKSLKFFTADGREAKNAIYSKEVNGELIFYELLSVTGVKCEGIPEIPLTSINGKNTYRRLMIQRVFPHISMEEINKI
ncbi:hypothetical protein [Ornithobacterium rhinotracheale]